MLWLFNILVIFLSPWSGSGFRRPLNPDPKHWKKIQITFSVLSNNVNMWIFNVVLFFFQALWKSGSASSVRIRIRAASYNADQDPKPVFRIRISFHADPDPGSQKFPYGSGSGSGSKEVNTKEEKVNKLILN